MGFYRDQVYPRLVNGLGDPTPIRDRRRQLLPRARGTVLEIGVGSGANFPHYDAARVDRIYALEPNPRMVQLAERRLRRTALTVEFLGVPGERIPLADVCVDTVVSTFTLCTIPGVVDALRDVHRVMKPGGRPPMGAPSSRAIRRTVPHQGHSVALEGQRVLDRECG
jgi:ubiquinone/menaquinone biosynthesis C-methylase UbiE